MEWLIIVPILSACAAYVVWRAYRAGRRLTSTDATACGCSCQGCQGRECPTDHRPGAALLVLALAWLAAPAGAKAADTIETWAQGATDVDFYLGMDGVGRPDSERSLGTDIMFGYGIREGFSAYLGATLSADGRLRNGGGALYTGLFGTPVDSEHLDLDLLLHFELAGEAADRLGVAPGVELVYTSHPDMLGWGLYLRGFAHMSGARNDAAADGHAIHVDLAATLGAFFSLAEDHQLLLELDGTYRPGLGPEDDRLELGGAAVGYNLVLSPSIELINQVFVDLPQARAESVAVGIMVGFIATLPAS